MKKATFLLLPILLFIQLNVFASGGSGNPPLVQYHSFSGQLDSKSDTLRRKYFHIEELNLQADEMMLVKYSSLDYAVSLYVRGSSGDTLGSVDIPKYYSDKGSHLTYLFKQSKGGRFQLLLTSKDSLETGKFTVHLASFNTSSNPFDDNWEFCQKLDYLLQQSPTDFQFVTGEKAKGFSLTNTRNTDLYLVTPSTCEIEYFTSDVYVCTLLQNMNLEKCIQKMKEMDYEIKQCLSPEWKISEKRRDDVTEINRARFEKELDYKLPGRSPDDHNEFHEKANLKSSVRLLIEKNLSGDYDLKIILE
jgi:hypothetical protein